MANFIKQAGDFFSGSRSDPGLLGLGQYKAGEYGYDADTFENTKASDARRKEFAKALAQRQNVATPQAQAAQIQMAQQNQFRNQQMNLANQLQQQAAGQGPSLAQSQLRQATDRNIAQSMAMAASQRGRGAGQNLRGVMQNQALANQQAAQQSADLRMQEQMAARQQLAGLTASGREQDIGLATNQANLQQNASLANQQAALAAQAQKDQMAQFYGTQQVGLDQYDQNRKMALELLRGQQFANAQDLNYSGYESAANRRSGFISGIAEGMGSMASMSDENQKKNISQVDDDELTKFLKGGSSGAIQPDRPAMSEGSPDTSKYSPSQDAASAPAKSQAPTIAPIGASSSGSISTGEAQRAMGASVGKAIGKVAKSVTDNVEKIAPLAAGAAVSDERNKINVEPVSSSVGGISPGHFSRGGGEGEKEGGGKGLSKIFDIASMVSDRNSKKQFHGYPENKVENFVNALKAYEYKYKNPDLPGAGEGKFISPMAQDIEKSELGKGMVEDTPVGKMVNYGKAGGLMLATAAMLNDKVNSLEEQLASALKKRRGK